MVGFVSLKSCHTCFFMTTLAHDSPIFQHCLWRICLTPSPFSVYHSLLTLFHLKRKLPPLSKSLPGLSLLHMCFLLLKLRSQPVFDCQSACGCLAFSPHATSLKTVHPPSSHSFSHQESQVPASQYPSLKNYVCLKPLKAFLSFCRKMCYAEVNFSFKIESCPCTL